MNDPTRLVNLYNNFLKKHSITCKWGTRLELIFHPPSLPDFVRGLTGILAQSNVDTPTAEGCAVPIGVLDDAATVGVVTLLPPLVAVGRLLTLIAPKSLARSRP